MNVLFISTVRSDFYIGVYKKIKYQVLGFKQNNSSVDLVYCKDKNYYLNDEIIGGFWISSLRALSLFRLLIKFNLKKYDVLYVRYIYPSILTYLLIKLAIVRGFKGKVLVEIPSYPYEGEYSGSVLSKIVLRVDKYFARFLKKVVNKIVTYSEDSDIFEIPCVNIFNGIPEIESSEFSKKRAEKDIVITSVANYSFWHGVDRILNSMNEYRIENLKLNIVGFGVEINRLKEIVNNSSYLSNCVSFLGAKYDKELHEIYKNTDIALGCLGNHRKGIHTIQALKNREYCAYGLPMIFSEDDPGFRDAKFIYRPSEDESFVNMEELVEWFKKLDVDKSEIISYSMKFIWKSQIQKIIKEVK